MNTRNMILTLVMLSLTACHSGSLPDVGSIQIVPEKLNQQILLTTPGGWNDFKLGKKITLSIKNVSKDPIVFDADYGIRIFMYDAGEWVEVDNQLIRLNTEDILLEPIELDSTATGTITILPNLNSHSRRLTVRVYVIGYLYKDNKRTNDVRGAFIDVVLKKVNK